MSWIPVSASLPEPYQDVLVVVPNEFDDGPDHVYMAARVPEWRITLDESGINIKPILWMPIPAPPELCGKKSDWVACRSPAGSKCPDCSVSLHDFGNAD